MPEENAQESEMPGRAELFENAPPVPRVERSASNGSARGRPSTVNNPNSLEFVQYMLTRRFTKGQIKKALQVKYPGHPRTYENLITRAKKSLLEGTGHTPDEERNLAIAFYESVIRDSEAAVKEKVRAMENITKLLGLDVLRIEQNGLNIHEHRVPPGLPNDPALLERMDGDAQRVFASLAGISGLLPDPGQVPDSAPYRTPLPRGS